MGRFLMLCLDIDGTLLSSEHRVTPRTALAIRQVVSEEGVRVVLVSARMPSAMRFLQEAIGVSEAMICYNGALVLDEREVVLASHVIGAECVDTICSCADNAGVHTSLYLDDRWYVESMDYWARHESAITGVTPVVTHFGDLISGWRGTGSGPNKILCMGEPDQLGGLLSALSAAGDLGVTRRLSKPTYLEIVSSCSSKRRSIQLLQVLYGIRRDEVMAIGDGCNDIEMIEYAGLGIAMGNAPQEVREAADVITSSNDEDGVAEAICTYLLSGKGMINEDN